MKVQHIVGALLVAVPLALAGCNAKKEAEKPAPKTGEQAKGGGDADAHPSEGPHGGELIEIGDEEFHAELVHDDAAGKVTIYILDSTAKKAVPLPEKEVTVNIVMAGKATQKKLPAVRDEADPAGQSSRFELADAAFSKALDAEGANPTLTFTFAGKTYRGSLSHDHEGHDHAGHDHDHEDGEDDHEHDHE